MEKEKLYIFDTTLRDGQQTAGVDFSVADKIRIMHMLDALGVDYIEGGYPGANPTDSSFFSQKYALQQAQMTAFGMTKRAGRSVDNDPGFKEILHAQSDAICLVAKSWDYHVDIALGITEEENLTCISESVKAIIDHGREAMIDCEHFFDGFKANRDYAVKCALAALEAGARWVVLCDTNGGCLPHEIYDAVTYLKHYIPGTHLGIHTHNDTEHAVANSLVAIRAGVRQVQGTLNGLGERCGNANLLSLIPTLLLKPPFANEVDIAISPEQLKNITEVSRNLDDILNRIANPHAAYVGSSAFAHKGGIHASAVLKEPQTYEHVPPEAVGNMRRIVVSDQAGKSNIIDRLQASSIAIEKDDPALERILYVVKQKENAGFSYEAAGASFEILALDELGRLPHFFDVLSYETSVHKQGEKAVTQAVVALRIDGETVNNTGTGNGPINALDMALRQELGRSYKAIDDMRLIDYKVRILNRGTTTGTEALTRVTIESADAKGNIWRTVGVDENIVIASFEALRDAVIYKLLKADDEMNLCVE